MTTIPKENKNWPVPDLLRAIRDCRFFVERLAKDRPDTYEIYQVTDRYETRLSDSVKVLLASLKEREEALILVAAAMEVLRPQVTNGTDVADVLDSFIPAVQKALGE